jgi:hypothetical protein
MAKQFSLRIDVPNGKPQWAIAYDLQWCLDTPGSSGEHIGALLGGGRQQTPALRTLP